MEENRTETDNEDTNGRNGQESDRNRTKNGQQSIVYFIKANDYMKIGKTDNLERRFREIQHAYPYTIKIQYYIDMYKEDGGGKRTPSEKADYAEKHLHMLFHHTRQKGEWFKITPFMLDYIEYIKQNGYWTDNAFIPFLIGPSKENHSQFWEAKNTIDRCISSTYEYGDYFFLREIMEELVEMVNHFSNKKFSPTYKYLTMPYDTKE
jgi:hypothetical protein